ncbi:MAG: SDR family oxidoreductase [Candidatus Hydrogenedentes bacterium]|nr:SDR family oxidoreductase [Candidatus Hydrogenedentota bacterium]
MACYLITGGGGFIGSNLARSLSARGDEVRVLDDFSTGRRENLDGLLDRIEVIEGSVCDPECLARAFAGVDYCLHQAAIPSVPRSVQDPVRSNHANVEGTIQVFLAARDAGAKRVVFASSSSVYGEVSALPAAETLPLNPISPYGVTKATCEMYARVFTELYGTDIVALRYFNVFGPRQDPKSQYAAVMPIFIMKMLAGEAPPVYGDGTQSRDFSYVDNVVAANLAACAAPGRLAGVYNIACGATTSVLDVVEMLNEILGTDLPPAFLPPRPGDIHLSYADIARARDAMGYEPAVTVREGLERTVAWYRDGKERP